VGADVDRPILLDNTVLTNFALAGEADLVLRLWPGRACTTPSVLDEYVAGAAVGVLPADAWAGLPVVTLTQDERAFAAGLSPRLGAGERTCLAVAVYRQGLLVSDDLDARRAARQRDVPTTGSVGILIRCVQRGHLARDGANHLLAEMIAQGYRSPVADLNLFLDEL
jgi:predicted nucleic acid-binding protein